MSEPTPQTAEGNFLVALKNKLSEYGLFKVTEDPKVVEALGHVDNWIGEFGTYIGAANVEVPTLTDALTCQKAQEAQGNLQRQMDRLTYCYVAHLSIYNNLKRARDMAAYYVTVESTEVRNLKNDTMRSAAVNFVLDPFNEALGQLDQLYDAILQCRAHIDKTQSGIRLQLALLEAPNNMQKGSGRSLHG